MPPSIYPALRFKENVKAALECYSSIFPTSQITQQPLDTAVKAQFSGIPFVGINGNASFITHSSISFIMTCETCSKLALSGMELPYRALKTGAVGVKTNLVSTCKLSRKFMGDFKQ